MDIYSPLAGEDIQKKIGCKFILYEDMHKVKDIRELLPKTLILYQLARVGHFCCVFENTEGINFFDPYGTFVDDELKIMCQHEAGQINHDFAYLTQLLLNQPRKIIYNEHKLQGSGSSVCGHWCAIRMIFSKLHNDEFFECFRGIKNKDVVIWKLYNSF